MTDIVRDAYLAVRHLRTAEAARRLGRTCTTVAQYRAKYPDMDYRAFDAPVTPRPGMVTLAIPIVEPSRACAVNGERIMRVSLPAPPAGITFERQGVKV